MDNKRLKRFLTGMAVAFIVLIAACIAWNSGILMQMFGGLTAVSGDAYIETELAYKASRVVVTGSRLLTPTCVLFIVSFALMTRGRKVKLKKPWILPAALGIVAVVAFIILISIAADRILKSALSLSVELASLLVMILFIWAMGKIIDNGAEARKKALKVIMITSLAGLVLDLIANYSTYTSIVLTIISLGLLVASYLRFVVYAFTLKTFCK